MSALSNVEEINKRGPIYEIDKSKIRVNTFIITFINGSQANCNGETMNKLNKK